MDKLGERGKGEVDLGAQDSAPLRSLGKRRKPENDRVAGRVAAFCKRDCAPSAIGVRPLNAGFFQLERLRAETVAKAKARKKRKVKSK